MHNLVNRTNLGVFIQNKGAIKFQNSKVCDMFSQMIVDHSDNTEKLFLDKDYFYKKKLLPIDNLEMLKNRNSIQAIKQRAGNRMQNFSINEIMSKQN